LGGDIDLEDSKNYWVPGQEGIQQRFQQLGYYNNPYLLAYENLHTWDKDVVYGQITGTYTFIPEELALKVRVGANNNSFGESEKVPKSMIYYGVKSKGDYIVKNTRNFTINNDLILTYNKKISDLFEVESLAGASLFYDKESWFSSKTYGLSVPDFYNMANSINPGSNSNILEESQTKSVYANINLKIWKPFYLSLTGRNDWVSTLPVNNNSFFYPSVSFSTVLSDVIKMPAFISFLKVRSSYAKVNSGWTGSTYGHIQTYSISTYNNMPTMSVPSTLVPGGLYPSGSRSYEIGGNMAIFNNRLNVDVAYFNRLEYDNIISMNVSQATGYTSVKDNGREYVTKGLELVINAGLLKGNDFNWDVNFNYSTSHQYLESLESGLTRDGYIKLGERTDQIYKYKWLRNSQGELILDSKTGLPIRDNYMRNIGNYDPDFIYGLQTTFRYKRLSLSISMDGRKGGMYFSILPRMGRAGTSTDYDSKLREDAANGLRNYVPKGVIVKDGAVQYDWEGNITSDTRVYEENTVATSYQDYLKSYWNMNNTRAESFLPATYLKLRDVSVSYEIPTTFINRFKISYCEISLVGSNLWILTKKASKGDDPSWVRGRDSNDLNHQLQ
ncbi:MAG: TonB-dependent receptor, partial [Bacteroidetes bacterium]|nr:TonB-dependent receptor [Bacteroidota bacterium]